jgi:hypothetical protein
VAGKVGPGLATGFGHSLRLDDMGRPRPTGGGVCQVRPPGPAQSSSKAEVLRQDIVPPKETRQCPEATLVVTKGGVRWELGTGLGSS